VNTTRPVLAISVEPQDRPEWWGSADSGLTAVANPTVRWVADVTFAVDVWVFARTLVLWTGFGLLVSHTLGLLG